jgi:hypothetical protein
LEKAVARARGSAWPWQLEEAAGDAEKVLERWKELGKVEAAMASRSAARLRGSLSEARYRQPSLDTREAEKLLSVRMYKLNSLHPEPESAWLQPLSL